MRWNTTVKLLLIVTIFYAIVLLIAISGLLDFLAEGGKVGAITLGSVVVYWVLSSLSILIVPHLRGKWRELSSGLLSTLITLMLIEVGVRYVSTRFHGIGSSEYHHLYPPNKEMFMGIYEGKRVLVKTNEDGLRSKYSREAFLKYKDRIMILGDSFTFGWGVRQASTFPEVTERLLRERLDRDNIAIINAGIVSYSPFLSKLLFSGKLKAYTPSTVLLFVDASDIGDDIKYTAEAIQMDNQIHFNTRDQDPTSELYEVLRPYINRPLQFITHPFDVLHRKILNPRDKYDYYSFKLTIGNTVEINRFFIYRHSLEETRPYFMKTLGHINDIAAECSSIGAQFILVIIPRYHHWNTAESPKNWERKEYAVDEKYQYEYFRFFEEVKEKINYHVFSLLPAFQATEEFPLTFEEDLHWNEKGHAFVAATVTNYLLQNHFLEQE